MPTPFSEPSQFNVRTGWPTPAQARTAGQSKRTAQHKIATSRYSYKGELKSFNASMGYGFLACAETHRAYGQDVFVHASQLKEAGLDVTVDLRLMNVTFQVEENSHGQPQARRVRAAAGPAGPVRLSGRLKSYGREKGFGMISGEEIHRRYGRDVFLPRRQFEEAGADDSWVLSEVSFEVKLTAKGPQAHDLRLETPGPLCRASGEGPQATPSLLCFPVLVPVLAGAPVHAQGGFREQRNGEVSPSDRQQSLGSKLFPLVEQQHPELADKLTGMLLDALPQEVLQSCLESEEVLKDLITQALCTLRADN